MKLRERKIWRCKIEVAESFMPKVYDKSYEVTTACHSLENVTVQVHH
jgi:hypothetical protein